MRDLNRKDRSNGASKVTATSQNTEMLASNNIELYANLQCVEAISKLISDINLPKSENSRRNTRKFLEFNQENHRIITAATVRLHNKGKIKNYQHMSLSRATLVLEKDSDLIE